MTFQEAIDQGRKIVFHGHEPGFWLISFDDETEVRRFSNREVKAVTDARRLPEEIEQDLRHEETTLMVNAEMSDRLQGCNFARLAFIIVGAIFAFMVFYSLHVGQPSALWFFVPVLCVMLLMYRKNEKERKTIVNFFKWRKDQVEEWG